MSNDSILADFLRKAATEVEELRVQLALGKAEAHDKYEELKKKFGKFISGAKIKTQGTAKSATSALRRDLEELEVQLALGKAETRDQFIEQKKRIESTMRKVERKIKGALRKTRFEDEMLHEFEKVRLKLELLRMNYALGKMEVKDALEKQKHDLKAIISQAKAKTKMTRQEFAQRRQQRHAEMKEAYKHLKKAL